MKLEVQLRVIVGLMGVSLNAVQTHGSPPTCNYIEISANLKENMLKSYEEIQCQKNNICAKNFTVTFIELVPYFRTGNKDANDVRDMLGKCCGNCVRYTSTILKDMTKLTGEAINGSDFVFPIFASTNTKSLYGFHYLPWIPIPSTYYITKHKDDIIEKILLIWPALLTSSLLAFIAGFVGWALETWENEEEFPRPFHIGLFEGFWWSFVSMTTVGYGDKAPKSRAGRLFGAIWIVIGIVAFGIVTSDLTSKIVSLSSPPPEKMDGKKVGTLSFRDYDMYAVSTSGGKIVLNNDVNDFASDLQGLVNKLMSDEIDGFLLDKYTLWFVTNSTKQFLTSEQETFFLTETVRTEQEVKADTLSYGLLIRNTDDYNFFRDFLFDAQLRKTIELSVYWTEAKETIGGLFYSSEGENTLISPKHSIFPNTMIALVVIIIVICIIGVFYELHRRKILCAGNQVADMEKSNEN